MDVKDIQGARSTLQKPANTLNISKLEIVHTDSIVISVDSKTQSQKADTLELRKQLNGVINIVNIAAEATKEIENMVNSISGIAEQISQDGLSPKRKEVLENEAKGLISEIRKRAEVSSSDGIKPLSGDKVRLEVENEVGRTLEFVFPDEAKEAFGLSSSAFSAKESIIDTIANVRRARERVENLKKAVDTTQSKVRSTALTTEVAIQNKDASEVLVRDLDEAVRLAGDTKIEIAENPEKALKSIGKLEAGSLNLLE